jgi:hypothetical protein
MHGSDRSDYNAQYQRLNEGLRKAGEPEGKTKPN